jgi:SAM-dependent methyltransferase
MSQEIPFELESLSNAKRYQRWLYESVRPWLGKRILELGSGIGNLSQHLPVRERLILSDIDPLLLKELRSKVPFLPAISVVQVDPSQALAETFRHENLDTIISFNVLEHVEDDARLLTEAWQLLRESKANGPKRIVTVVPAHQFAYGNLDRQFGHFRRYSRRSFRQLIESAVGEDRKSLRFRSFYMNLPALLGWWLNGRVLGKSQIGAGNMKLFEKLCPVIRPLDTLLQRALRFPMGNSLVVIIELREEA